MHDLNYDNNPMLNYTEFLAATVEMNLNSVSSERRDAIFKIFDVSNTDSITRDDMKKAFNKIGRNLSDN